MQITESEQAQSYGAMVSQSSSTGGLKKNYIYLDTCTTEDQMVNLAYLSRIKSLIINSTMLMNCYPDKQGVSDDFSPHELVLR